MRILVVTSGLNYPVRKGVAALLGELREAEALVVVHGRRKSAKKLLKSQWANLRRHGWRWIPYQLGNATRLLRGHLRPRRLELHGGPGDEYSLEAIGRRARFLWARDVHDAETLEQIRRYVPDLGVSLGAPILKPSVFAIPRLGTLNLHQGKVPDYKGMPPAFWELWHEEKEVGCTVHRVEETLDTGSVVAASSIPVRPFSTLEGLQLTLDEMGVRLMVEAARRVLAGTAPSSPQPSGGRTFRRPTLNQERALRRKLAPQVPSRPRAIAKSALFKGYAGVLAPLPRRVRAWTGAQRIVVLLYHRVNDDMRDTLTVGIDQFDRQMAVLARRCRVLDIRDVVAGKVERDTARPLVAVTFDDGYRDNYENAFPLLQRHGVPAAFFVSTGKIGVDGAFEHDLRRLGHGLPTMTWQQLREMQGAGFVIGSHSISHLDCGRASLDEVRYELRESRMMLAKELGLAQPIFAYPFGSRSNMTPQALEAVRQEGYVGCLSAYGGRNDGPIDAFDVRRTGVNHAFTEWSFRARIEGWS